MKTLTTDRLILRSFKEEDYDDLFEFLYQLKDDEFEGYPGITFENGKEYLKYRLDSDDFYAVELKSTGKVIGNIFCCNKEFLEKEVGYIINKEYTKQGYAYEALSAVIEYAFREGAYKIFAECDKDNEPSWKLLEKVGMKRDAHIRQDHRDNGVLRSRDIIVYSITESEYFSSK